MNDYLQEYLQQYMHNMVLRNQVRQLVKEKNELRMQIDKLEEGQAKGDTFEERKKRLRSLASQIERKFACPL